MTFVPRCTFELFAKLKRGDVVLWNGRPRIVLQGPADLEREPRFRSHYVVHFAKIQGVSRYGVTTTYTFNDAKGRLHIPEFQWSKGSRARLATLERDRILEQGGDPRGDFRHHLREYKRLQGYGSLFSGIRLKAPPVCRSWWTGMTE